MIATRLPFGEVQRQRHAGQPAADDDHVEMPGEIFIGNFHVDGNNSMQQGCGGRAVLQ